MKLLNIGQIIKSERLKKGISQEELAFGVCTTATLSRLENNLHTPTRSIYTSLINKIDTLGYFSCSLSNDPSIIVNDYSIFNSIYLYIEQRNYNKLKLLSQEITNYYEHTILIEQFNEAIKSLSLPDKPTNNTHISLLNAICLTITSFSENMPLQFILTQNEVLLIFSLAVYYKRLDLLTKSIDLMTNLITCIDTYSSELSFLSYSILLKELIILYIKNDDIKKAYSNIEKYILHCKKHSLYYRIPDIAYYESVCKIKLKLDEPYAPVIDAYYYYMAIDKFEEAKKIKEKTLSDFNINFELIYNEVK